MNLVVFSRAPRVPARSYVFPRPARAHMFLVSGGQVRVGCRFPTQNSAKYVLQYVNQNKNTLCRSASFLGGTPQKCFLAHPSAHRGYRGWESSDQRPPGPKARAGMRVRGCWRPPRSPSRPSLVLPRVRTCPLLPRHEFVRVPTCSHVFLDKPRTTVVLLRANILLPPVCSRVLPRVRTCPLLARAWLLEFPVQIPLSIPGRKSRLSRSEIQEIPLSRSEIPVVPEYSRSHARAPACVRPAQARPAHFRTDRGVQSSSAPAANLEGVTLFRKTEAFRGVAQ